VIHSSTVVECYEHFRRRDGKPGYRLRDDKKGKLRGYLRGVAINKVLLANSRWPFVLATRLYTDVTIGLDVKHNTAGLMVVGANGGDVRWVPKTSKQKEQLLDDQMMSYLVDVLRAESRDRATPIRSIVVHRDGRLWPSEIRGAQAAVDVLKHDGTLHADAEITMIEISKTSPAHLRLFETIPNDGRLSVVNPQVGTYMLLGPDDAYLCSTGRPFLRHGTSLPLHIRRVCGSLPLDQCVEDYYYLTTLTWTKPDDCVRDAITTRLNDRFLSEAATEFDEDALEFASVASAEVDI
jgi:argonaute-like protein implicated in RNA metabolism and viral defense